MNIWENRGKFVFLWYKQAGALGTLLLLLVRLLAHFIAVAIINGLLLYLVCRFYGVS